MELLDKRIDVLVRRRYTKQRVTHKDILPKSIDGRPTIEYMVERTFMRPRDIIQFFNYCIRLAVDTPKISVSMLKEAEMEYSHARLRALADEWRADYPHLDRYTELLRGRKEAIDVEEITDKACGDLCLELAIEGIDQSDLLAQLVDGVANGQTAAGEFRKALVQAFYTIGVVGLKLNSYDPPLWSSTGGRPVALGEILAQTRLHIHPVAWRGLGIAYSPKRSGRLS